MSILFYKKPDYITKEGGPLTKSSCQRYAEKAACTRSQIPPELSFENVMEGKTLPVGLTLSSQQDCTDLSLKPCSISDFLDYLIYISHDAENLQFWLWMRDYRKRFNALTAAQKRLSPAWTADDASTDTIAPGVPPKDDDKSFDVIGQASYHRAASENERCMSQLSYTIPLINNPSVAKQPFRREISQITTHYILPGAPRELNISHRDRTTLLAALSKTTHPSAFGPILELTTLTLRNHSHPNFVRWSICNGNKPRVLFLRSFAVFWLVIGMVMALTLILSSKSRWIRIAIAPMIWFGTVNLVAAARGLCVLLFRRSTREVHPWEIGIPMTNEGRSRNPTPLESNGQLIINLKPRNDKHGQNPSPTLKPLDSNGHSAAVTPFDTDLEALSVLSGRTLSVKLEPFGPSNNYHNQSWVERWRKTPWIRKLALKKVWVKEEGLRILQNKIILQAHMWGVIIMIPFVAAIVACPEVGLY